MTMLRPLINHHVTVMRPLIGHQVTVMISPLSGRGPQVSVAGLFSPQQPRVWRRYPLTRNSRDQSCHLYVIWENWPLIGRNLSFGYSDF